MPLDQDLISITFDTEASGKSKEILLAQMKEVLELSTKINNTKINIGSNTTGLKDFIKLQGDAEKSTTAYNKTLIASAKVIQEQEKAQQQALKTSKLREQQSERNAKAEERDAAARKKNADVPFKTNLNADGTVNEPKQGTTTGNVLNDLDKAQIEATNSATALGQAQSKVSNNLKVTKKSAEELRKEQELSHKIAVEDKLLASQRAAQLKNEVREQNAVKGSLEQRRAALIRLNAVYDNQSPQERASAGGIRLQKITAGLTQQVKTLEAETGRAQRNVGNYGNAITGAFGKAFSGLRTLANILPGLGISGLLLLIGEGLSGMVTSLFKAKEAVKAFSEEEVAARKSVANALGDEIGKITFLKVALESENTTRDNKKRIIDALIESQPKYFSGLKLEGDTVIGLAPAYDAYTASILKTAKAKASLNVLQEFYKKRLDLELQLTEDLTKVEGKFQDFQKRQTEAFKNGKIAPVQNFGKEDQKNILLAANIAGLDRQIQGVIKTITSSDVDIDQIIGGKPNKGKAAPHVKEITNKVDKLAEALERLYANSRKLALENKEPVPDSPLVKQAQDEAAAYEKSIERRIRANDEAFAKEQTAQLEQFRAGLINKEDYESSLIDIAEKYSKQAIQIQIDELVAEKEFAFDGVDQTQEVADKKAEIEKKIAQLRLQLLQGIQKAEDDDNKKRLEKLESFIQKAQKVLTEASNLISSVIDISVTKQKNALRDLEDERQKTYDREITNIKNSTLSEEEKQTSLMSLEATRQAQKEEFDRKNREADLKRAKFNKAATIAQIALETAAAVVHQLGSGDPFTAIPRAIAVGVLGAAKLAIAIATPLPKYATGLKNAGRDHIGMYGEAGSELVEMPGQDAFIAHKATIGFIPKGTSITPLSSNEINQMMHRVMMEQTASKITKPDYDDRLERAFEKHSNRMIKAMGKRPAAYNNRMEAKYQVDLLKTVYGRG